MATAAENLITRRDAICAELAALDSTMVGGKANAPGSPLYVDHVGYKDALYRELREINSQIAAISGPVEAEHYGSL